MNATQVFLRFVKEECRNNDGTFKTHKLGAWRRELRNNSISSIIICYRPIKRIRSSKNYVDDYISSRGFTLGGFMSHFVKNRYSNFRWAYGNESDLVDRLRKRWRTFLDEHIEGEVNRYWIKGRTFEFTWKN